MEKQKDFNFRVIATDEKYPLMRAGEIQTPHGSFQTPAFQTVGTEAHVRFVDMKMLHRIGAPILLSNGYHNFHQNSRIDMAGGLAKYNNWNGPTTTDSAGFQVQSLGNAAGKVISIGNEHMQNQRKTDQKSSVKIHRVGAEFRDPHDGRIRLFTPEVAIENQHKIGADIMMSLDYLSNDRYDPKNEKNDPEWNKIYGEIIGEKRDSGDFADDHEYQDFALELSREWALSGLREHVRQTNLRASREYQALYYCIQGAGHEDLREKSAKYGAEMNFDGVKFDGFSIGGILDKRKTGLKGIMQWTKRVLPADKPIHVLGLSYVDDIFIGIENGADTLDCVAPQKEARHGRLYTKRGNIPDIRNAKFREDFGVIDDECDCPVCTLNFRENYELLPDEIAGYYSDKFDKLTPEMLAEKIAKNEEKIANYVERLKPLNQISKQQRREMDDETRENFRETKSYYDTEKEKLRKLNENLREIQPIFDAKNERKITRADLAKMLRADDPEVHAIYFAFATTHNLRFTIRTIDEIRESIIHGNYANFREEFFAKYYGENRPVDCE